jgi:hypothetical protein
VTAPAAVFARDCEQRPAGDPRRDDVVTILFLDGTQACIARHSGLTEPFLRRAVGA